MRPTPIRRPARQRDRRPVDGGRPRARGSGDRRRRHLPRRSEDGAESAQSRGAHIGTASFMVSSAARGKGVGRALARDMIDWHEHQGYAGIQFNAVVETNMAAVRLWQDLGFGSWSSAGRFGRPRADRSVSTCHAPRPLLLTAARADGTSVLPPTVDGMSPELEIVSFDPRRPLGVTRWFAAHHPGVWGPAGQGRRALPSVTFHDLLEAGIAHGWSESTRRAHEMTAHIPEVSHTVRNDLAAQCLDRRPTGGKRPHGARRTRRTGPPGSPGRGQDLRRWRMTPGR